MKRYLLFALAVLMISVTLAVSAQAQYVKDHNNCPAAYLSQNCPGGEKACGYDVGLSTLFCNASVDVNAAVPAGDAIATSQQYDAALGGGYVLNCVKDDTTCLPWTCQRDNTCYDVPSSRETTCTGGTTTSTCSAVCLADYVDCDGNPNTCEIRWAPPASASNCTNIGGASGFNNRVNQSCQCECDIGYLNCTGSPLNDGCEILIGEACTIFASGLNGTCQNSCGITGNTSSGYNCSCVGSPVPFYTGVLSGFATSNPLLWGETYGTGWLMNLTSIVTGVTFGVNASGCIVFPDGSRQCSSGLTGGLTLGNLSIVNSTTPALWIQQNGTGWLANLTSTENNATFGINGSGCIVFPDGSTQCIAGGGAGMGNFVNSTPGIYNGSITAGGFAGYKAANFVCDSNFTASHWCTTDEILATIVAKNVSAILQWAGFGWVAEGPPGFTANANDCIGMKNNSNLVLGAFWIFNQTTGGEGWLTPCSSSYPLTCCR
jgi:hypothetical protein